MLTGYGVYAAVGTNITSVDHMREWVKRHIFKSPAGKDKVEKMSDGQIIAIFDKYYGPQIRPAKPMREPIATKICQTCQSLYDGPKCTQCHYSENDI